jgi:two-component system, NarL family, sensor kinase
MQETFDYISFSLVISSFMIIGLLFFLFAIVFLYVKKQAAIRHHFERAHLEVQEATYQQVSREIHDNINLSLTLAKLYLNTVNFIDTEKAEGQISSSTAQITKAITDLRNISRGLNSDLIMTDGLLRAIELELKKIRDLHIYEVYYDIEGEPFFMESKRELIVFRIIQECLNNILKHAKATIIRLHLKYSEEGLHLSISDNGNGFDYDQVIQDRKKESKAGLSNIEKRVSVLSGKLQIFSKPNQGTLIISTIPNYGQ